MDFFALKFLICGSVSFWQGRWEGQHHELLSKERADSNERWVLVIDNSGHSWQEWKYLHSGGVGCHIGHSGRFSSEGKTTLKQRSRPVVEGQSVANPWNVNEPSSTLGRAGAISGHWSVDSLITQ